MNCNFCSKVFSWPSTHPFVYWHQCWNSEQFFVEKILLTGKLVRLSKLWVRNQSYNDLLAPICLKMKSQTIFRTWPAFALVLSLLWWWKQKMHRTSKGPSQDVSGIYFITIYCCPTTLFFSLIIAEIKTALENLCLAIRLSCCFCFSILLFLSVTH